MFNEMIKDVISQFTRSQKITEIGHFLTGRQFHCIAVKQGQNLDLPYTVRRTVLNFF